MEEEEEETPFIQAHCCPVTVIIITLIISRQDALNFPSVASITTGRLIHYKHLWKQGLL